MIVSADFLFVVTVVVTPVLTLESFNGVVSESVSKNTDVVIVGDKPGSKYQDALRLNIMIWDNKKTLEVLNNLPKA